MLTGWNTFPRACTTADLFVVRGRGFVGRQIRRASRRDGEAPTYASHAGVVIEDGRWILEAQPQGVVATYAGWKGEDRRAVVFRPNCDHPHLPPIHKQICVEHYALEYFGQRYGYFKLAVHLFDAFDPFGLNLMERIGWRDRYPICSWIAAYAYDRAGIDLRGLNPSLAQPDDLVDLAVDAGWELVWASDLEEVELLTAIYGRFFTHEV